MKWQIAILILFLSIGDDLLVVWYFRRVVKGDLIWAAILSGVITAVVSWEVIIYAPDPRYIPFNAAGSAIGTPLAIWLEDRLPRVYPRRDKKGKFKPTPAVAKKAEYVEEKPT